MQLKQAEDMRRMHQVYEEKAKEQQIQMANMVKANFEERRRERELFFQQQTKLYQQKLQEIENVKDALSRQNQEKGKEIQKSSQPGMLSLLAPIGTFVMGLAAKALTSCSIM